MLKKFVKSVLLPVTLLTSLLTHAMADKAEVKYTMPEESEPHAATWLQWPHHYQYGKTYRNRLDQTWVDMTAALVTSETVNLIVYNEVEKQRVTELLEKNDVSLDNVKFFIIPNDDVWVRDNGPIYVHDKDGNLLIEGWGFNAWGNKYDWEQSQEVPQIIAEKQGYKFINLQKSMINEGGSVEINGHGTLMATRSAILNKNRNPDLTQKDVENLFTTYLGATNFIWLDGVPGLEITDMHIDGFARFGNKDTIVTMSEDDLLEWEVLEHDIETLYDAKDQDGNPFKFVQIPLTKNNVTTAYGKKLGYKGSYINYYIANKVVLVPNYNDENDSVANAMIQKLYPNRKVIGIDVRNLYENGGMIHCVTQQQPLR